MLPARLMLPPALALKKPPSPMPERAHVDEALRGRGDVGARVRFTSQELQSPPLGASCVETETEPSGRVDVDRAAAALRVAERLAVRPDAFGRVAGDDDVAGAALMSTEPPKAAPAGSLAFAVSGPFTVTLVPACSVMLPPPKLLLVSIFDLLVPCVWMSMKPSPRGRPRCSRRAIEMNRAPGVNVMLLARIFTVPAPVSVSCLFPTDSDLGRMSYVPAGCWPSS
jgi:hypothetical protein